MIVNLGYKYKLVTNKKQKTLLVNHLFSHNQAWNILLNESQKQYKENEAIYYYNSDGTLNKIEDNFVFKNFSDLKEECLKK